jgi:hypothetical protein
MRIREAIIVVVWIAFIADPVTICILTIIIGLWRIRDRAIITSISISVEATRWIKLRVVLVIINVIIIIIVIADITETITISVTLVSISVNRTVISAIKSSIAVRIGVSDQRTQIDLL